MFDSRSSCEDLTDAEDVEGTGEVAKLDELAFEFPLVPLVARLVTLPILMRGTRV